MNSRRRLSLSSKRSNVTEHNVQRFQVLQTEARWVLSCNCRVYFLWQHLLSACAVLMAFIAPFAITFAEVSAARHEGDVVLYVGLVIDVVFLAEIAANFNTSFLAESGEEIKSRRTIAHRYLRRTFWVDVIAAVPWVALALACRGNAAIALLLLSLVRLARLLPRRTLGVESKFVQVCKMGLGLALLTHWCACLWYAIVSPDQTWIPSSDVLNGTDIYAQSALNRYFLFLYYATIILVQGGELFPVRDQDTFLITFLELMGVVAFTMVFSKVSLLVQQSDAASGRFRRKLEAVEAASLELGLPAALHRKLLSAIELQVTSFQLESFLLVQSLSESLFKDVLASLLVSVPSLAALRDLFHPRVQEKFLRLLKPSVCVPEEVIFREFQQGDSLYFLYRGAIKASVETLNLQLRPILVGSMFGTTAVVSYSHKHCYTATAARSSLLFSLSSASVAALSEMAPRLSVHLKTEMQKENAFWLAKWQLNLQLLPYLSDLTLIELLEVALISKPMIFAQGTPIIQRGQTLPWVVLVFSGQLSVQTHVVRSHCAKQPCILQSLGAGSVYGVYTAAKATNVQVLDLVATETATCLLLPQQAISDLTRFIPRLGKFNISLHDLKKDDFIPTFLNRQPWSRVKTAVIRILRGFLQRGKVGSLAVGESLAVQVSAKVQIKRQLWKQLQEILQSQESLQYKVSEMSSHRDPFPSTTELNGIPH